jgi:uncharacterized protein (TIGR00369 family)
MAIAVTEEELRRVLASAAFAHQFGFVLHSFDEDACTIRVPFRKDFERPGGIVCGPVFMAAADVAMWLAILTRLGVADGAVTVEMKTNFLSGAREEEFLCSAKVLKLGRRLVYGVAECSALDGRLLTHSTVTYIRQ